jgi:glycogen operon protein
LRRTRPTARLRIHSGRWTSFANLVKALHRAQIDVILDVVFNHTAEGDHDGPTL